MIFDITDALQSLRPGAEWVARGITYDNIEWLDSSKIPTKEEVLAEITRLQAEYDRNEYQRQRAAEYPSIQEQLDMQYWDSVNGTTTWQDAINAVKAKYPKPEGV